MQTFTGLSGGLLWALPRCRGLSPPFRTVLYTQRGLVKVEMEKQGFRVSRLNSHSSRFYPGDIASPVQASVALPVNVDGCIYLCPGLL